MNLCPGLVRRERVRGDGQHSTPISPCSRPLSRLKFLLIGVCGNDQILCGNVQSTHWVYTPQKFRKCKAQTTNPVVAQQFDMHANTQTGVMCGNVGGVLDNVLLGKSGCTWRGTRDCTWGRSVSVFSKSFPRIEIPHFGTQGAMSTPGRLSALVFVLNRET